MPLTKARQTAHLAQDIVSASGAAAQGVAPTYSNTGTAAAAGSFTLNPANGQVQKVTLTGAGAITFAAPTNIQEGAMYKLLLAAGDTSARTFSWNAAYKWPSASAQLTSGTITSGGLDIITFIGGAANTLIYDGHLADVR